MTAAEEYAAIVAERDLMEAERDEAIRERDEAQAVIDAVRKVRDEIARRRDTHRYRWQEEGGFDSDAAACGSYAAVVVMLDKVDGL